MFDRIGSGSLKGSSIRGLKCWPECFQWNEKSDADKNNWSCASTISALFFFSQQNETIWNVCLQSIFLKVQKIRNEQIFDADSEKKILGFSWQEIRRQPSLENCFDGKRQFWERMPPFVFRFWSFGNSALPFWDPSNGTSKTNRTFKPKIF